MVIREIYYPQHVCANDRFTIHPFSKRNKRVVTEKYFRFTDFQGKSIQDIQSLFNANPTRYFKHYTRVSLVRRALRDTLLGVKSPCWTLTIASIPQLATRPSSHLQASEQEHDNEISGDIFTVGKKRSRKESLSVEHDDIPFKKAHQRFPTTQLNQPSRENLRDANSCGEKEQTILKTTKRQKSVASSFAMYHEGVPDHAICTVTDTKGLQPVHQTFLTTRIHGKTMAECKRAYEMHDRELSGNCKTYHDYHGGDWHQYHCFWHRVNHKQSRGRAPRLSFTWS